jgi:sulfopyruvate decarboxylase alpha subunit
MKTDMPFLLFRETRRRLQSRDRNYCLASRLEMQMHARADTPSEQTAEDAASWPEEIFAILQRFDVRQVPYVPDAGHSQLIERVLGSSSMRGIALTTEEEGVALLAGAWAGGQRGVLLMQSSGVGNCINMLSLTQIFRFPFLTLVTMRGEWGEFNPWQVPMGSSTQAVFELSGIKVLRASHPDEVKDVMEAAASQAYNACTPTAVLLSQRLIGTKVFVK